MNLIRPSRLLPLLLALLLVSNPARSQHLVLFETFDNACDPCPATNIRAPFDDAAKSTAQSNSSKAIWLNHHIGNVCDPAAKSGYNYYSNFTGTRLSGSGNAVFYGAVDRAIFNSNGARISPSSSGGNYSDWSDMINQLYSNAPGATITLDSATMDKSFSPYVLTVYATVTALHAIPDSLILRFAITQDNVIFNSSGNCAVDPAPSPQNNVVRVVTYDDTGVYVIAHGGATSGYTKHIAWSQPIKTPSANPSWKLADMTLIGFFEESHGGSYQVVNAQVLKKDLDTLKSPAPTLVLIDSALDGHTFNAGDNIAIPFTSRNLPSGVNAYYSLDNGSTWRFISAANFATVNWTIPDSLTTQGKIKLVAIDDANLQVIEKGTFTIVKKPTIRILHPLATDTARANQPFTIQWTSFGVSKVKLQYSLANQQNAFATWTTIADGVEGTSYTWTVPDTVRMAEIQITDVDSNAAAETSAPFPIFRKAVIDNAVNGEPGSNGLAITDVYPNPAANGVALTVRYLNDDAGHTPFVTVQLLDLLGHIAYQDMIEATESSISIPTRSLAAGTYLVRLTDGDHASTKRIEVLH